MSTNIESKILRLLQLQNEIVATYAADSLEWYNIPLPSRTNKSLEELTEEYIEVRDHIIKQTDHSDLAKFFTDTVLSISFPKDD